MNVLQGHSLASSTTDLLREACADWGDAKPDIIFAFCSSVQAPEELLSSLRERYPDTLVVGCTTAGEHLSGQHFKSSCVLTALVDSGVRWSATLIEDIKSIDEEIAHRAAEELFEALEVSPDRHFDPEKFFCLLFIDGLAMAEERVATLLADALEGVRLVGGSAGDDLAFEETLVFYDGGVHAGAACAVMGHTIEASAEFIKHQNFVETQRSLVITRADLATRTVYEIDGYPAAQAYGAALGLLPSELSEEVANVHPVMFKCNGEIYMRGIQRFNEDNSITFYCGIEEGMVLEIADHKEMVSALSEDLSEEEPADFMIAFNCIQRAMESDRTDSHEDICQVMNRHSRHVIGFDTYGEQLDGLHINQTLVALALRRTPSSSEEVSR